MFAVAGIPRTCGRPPPDHHHRPGPATPQQSADIPDHHRSSPDPSARRAHAVGPGDWLLTEWPQQASRPVVAQRRARKLAEQGVTEWVDLGCGVGSTASLHRRGNATRRWLPPRHNLEVLAPDEAVRSWLMRLTTQAPAAAARSGPAPVTGLTGGTRPRRLAPPWSCAAVRRTRPHIAKVAPGSTDLPGAGSAVEWVSVAELVEATVWFANWWGPARHLLTPGHPRAISGFGRPVEVGR
jgi:hypothetical protein